MLITGCLEDTKARERVRLGAIVPQGGTAVRRKSRQQIGTVGGRLRDRRINHKINDCRSVYGDRVARCLNVCGVTDRQDGVGRWVPAG